MYRKIKKRLRNKSFKMNSLKERLKAFLLKLKGEDNYLTTETITIGLIAAVFIIAIAVMILFPRSRYNPKNIINNNILKITPTPSPTLTPTPRPIAKGPQQYSIGTRQTPQLRTLDINEFDPKKGETQKMTVKAVSTNNTNISSVLLKLITDHKTTDISFKLILGTELDGTWEASWITDDSHDYIYTAAFIAKDIKGNESKIDLSFR